MINPLELEFEFKETITEIMLAFVAGKHYREIISCKAMYFDFDGEPNSWGIYKGNSVLSKSLKVFLIEPLPSSRDDEFIKDCRFPTKESAIKFFKENFLFKKINKTIQENYDLLPKDNLD